VGRERRPESGWRDGWAVGTCTISSKSFVPAYHQGSGGRMALARLEGERELRLTEMRVLVSMIGCMGTVVVTMMMMGKG